MAIEKLAGGGLVITGDDIKVYALAAAMSCAKLDLQGIKMRYTRLAWARLAQAINEPPPKSRKQKQALFDAYAPHFPIIAGKGK